MIYLVGLGPGDPASLSPQALSLLGRADLPLYVRTGRHPTLAAEPLAGALAGRTNIVFFDDEYERHPSFDATYDAIVARVLAGAREQGDIVYAVPGHPLVGETTVARLLPLARAEEFFLRVVGAPSFVDACLEAVGEAVTGDLIVIDALALEPGAPTPHPALRTPGAPMLLYQVHDRPAASLAKLALMRAGYPDNFAVTLLRAAGVPGEERVLTGVPLYALDRNPAGALCDHLTSVWVPPLSADARPPGLDGLVRVMARLRDKQSGCPWDIEQTHQSLRPYVIEEAYEVAEAIDENDGDKLCDELGDLLLQVVFHAQLAREDGVWDVDDVCAAIVSKLVRRHPHVFGQVKVAGAHEVLTNWNAIKATEKGNEKRSSVLDGVPASLPALARALEISRRAVKAGFEWPDVSAVLAKVDEEMAELKAEVGDGEAADAERVAGELGDVLFTLVNVGRRMGINPEDALRSQMKRFERRFRHIEARAGERGVALEALTLPEMEAFWQEAKQQEGSSNQP